ncbi:MAG TPA: ABC transporter permease [Myxococcales bacterium]
MTFSADELPEIAGVLLLTLRVGASGLLVGLAIGIPLGLWLALARFPGRRLVLGAANAGMGLPPVLVGLVVALLLWRSGPLGVLELMYSPAAMIVAQALIATPIVISLTAAGIQQLGDQLPDQLRALGASRSQLSWLLLKEARLPLLAAAMAAAGRLLSEVGAAMMVGGNIRGETRVLTTAMVLEVRQGQFAMALVMGLVLLVLALVVNGALTWLQQRRTS